MITFHLTPPKVKAAVKSVATCKNIIESLGKYTLDSGKLNDDRSGCSYAYYDDDSTWALVMAESGKCPTCDQVPGAIVQRVCFCSATPIPTTSEIRNMDSLNQGKHKHSS